MKQKKNRFERFCLTCCFSSFVEEPLERSWREGGGEGSVQGGQGTRSRGRTRFYYTHIESSGRPADSRRTTCSALFPLVCHTVSWFISLPSVFLLYSAFPFCLIIIIPYEIIRGYILLCCAPYSVLIIPICSVFPPCAFPLRLVSLLVFLPSPLPLEFAACSKARHSNPLLLSSDVIHQLDIPTSAFPWVC